MTDLQIKVEPEDDENHFKRFWEIADRIRKQVQKVGGLSVKEIDRLVCESRARRRKRNSL
ncbi:MAG: hypothetical protein ACREOI_27295 [bacterium]